MASVYLHTRGKSPYYQGVFMGADGKQKHRSTKLTNEGQALALCEKWERKAKLLRKARTLQNRDLVLETFIHASQRAVVGEFTEEMARDMFDAVLEATGQARTSSVTVKDFLSGWVESKEGAKAAGTVASYRGMAKEFTMFLGEAADRSILSLTANQVTAFRSFQLEQGKSETTANHKLRMLRTALNAARRQGLITRNPAEAVEYLDAEPNVRNPFTLEHVVSILAAASDEWRGLTLVGVCTGLRIGQASQLTWGTIDLNRETITVPKGKHRRGKPRRTLEIVILPDLLAYLKANEPPGPKCDRPLFPELSQIRPGGCNGLSQRFQELMHSAGVYAQEDKRPITGKGRRFNDLTFHSLRHTYISFMANAGVDRELRKKLAGHTTSVHDRYTHIELTTLQRALKDFPSVMERPSREGPLGKAP